MKIWNLTSLCRMTSRRTTFTSLLSIFQCGNAFHDIFGVGRIVGPVKLIMLLAVIHTSKRFIIFLKSNDSFCWFWKTNTASRPDRPVLQKADRKCRDYNGTKVNLTRTIDFQHNVVNFYAFWFKKLFNFLKSDVHSHITQFNWT